MNRRNLVLICSIILGLLTAPAANARWSAQGSVEPDVPADVADGFQFRNPDVDPSPEVLSVYFSGVFNSFWAAVNPNVAATGTRFAPAYDAPAAYLGVWKDCNGDGYVGMAETAVQEYSSLLLTDDATCLEGTTFNRGGWVYEFLWIYDGAAAKDGSNITNRNLHLSRFINASEVRVWGDSGLPPTSVPEESGGSEGCFANLPIGGASSTGALIDWRDCTFNHQIADSITDLDNGELCIEDSDVNQTVCEPNGLALNSGLGFGPECRAGTPSSTSCANGDNPQCTDSSLNVFLGIWADSRECPTPNYVSLLDPEGDEEDPYKHSAFTVWDCNGAIPVVVEDPTGGVAFPDDENTTENETELVNTFVPVGVSPSAGIANDLENNRSVYEGVNQTWSHCDSDAFAPITSQEQDVETAEAKVTNDYEFDFIFPTFGRNQREGRVCSAPGTGTPFPADTPVTDENHCTPRVLSERPENFPARIPIPGGFVGLTEGPAYAASTAIYTGDAPTFETRGSGTNMTVDGQGAFFKRFYAFVGGSTQLTIGGEDGLYTEEEVTLKFPGSGVGFYGSEWCGNNFDGPVRAGFDCDASHWYNPVFGSTEMPRNGAGNPIATIPGQTYNLRDTDCYDNSVASNWEDLRGVGAGLTILDVEEDSDGYPVGACASAPNQEADSGDKLVPE